MLFMLYNFITSVTTFLTLRTALSFRRDVVQRAIAILASIFRAGSGWFFAALLFALAFVRGVGVAFFEHLVAKVALNRKNVSVDIGWLHVPMHLAEFASVLTAGFVAQAVGYAPVFAATGVFFAVFSFMSFHQLRER
jgi:hypothetical protein